jgi:hypothetical protein
VQGAIDCRRGELAAMPPAFSLHAGTRGEAFKAGLVILVAPCLLDLP